MSDTRKDFKKASEEKATPLREIHYLAFSGGGWRTLYAQGVIEGFREEGALNKVIAASFCSGSCVPAVFLISGYDSKQSMQFLEEYVLNDRYTSALYFIPEHVDAEKSPYYLFGQQDGFIKRMAKRAANLGILSYLFVKNVVDAVRARGIFHIKSLEELLWRIIQKSPTLPSRLKRRDLTFSELHCYKDEFQQKYPNLLFIDPYIAVTQETAQGHSLKYYSYETTPNASILKAACASMTIPGLFRQVEKGLKDGGVVDNSARSAFDKAEMNMRTQAVYFAPTQSDIEKWRDKRQNPSPSSSVIMKLLGIDKDWELQEKSHHEGANALRTLYVDSSGISMLRPNGLTTEKFNKICQDTKKQAQEYARLYYSDTPCPHASLDRVPLELRGYYLK